MERFTKDLNCLIMYVFIRKQESRSRYCCTCTFRRKDTGEIYAEENIISTSYDALMGNVDSLSNKYENEKPAEWRERKFAELVMDFERHQDSYLTDLNDIMRHVNDDKLSDDIFKLLRRRQKELLHFFKSVNILTEKDIEKLLDDNNSEIYENIDKFHAVSELYEMIINPSSAIREEFDMVKKLRQK